MTTYNAKFLFGNNKKNLASNFKNNDSVYDQLRQSRHQVINAN